MTTQTPAGSPRTEAPTAPIAIATRPPDQAPAGPAPVLTPGTELIGPYQGSGFREPRFLAHRADGQVAQLPELLFTLATLVDGHRDVDALAAALGERLQREVRPDQVTTLLDRQLRPAGLVEPVEEPASDASTAGSSDRAARTGRRRGDHLFMLRYRAALVPARVVWRVAGVFAPLFARPVVALLLTAFVAVDVGVVATTGWTGLESSGQAIVRSPMLTLGVVGLALVAGIFHECGHNAACRYGGARPGPMGAGVYIVWPAFYSTVTDSYRLSRGGRLRTDLGGVYFNAVFLTGLGGAYLATGSSWLLLAALLLHLETAYQFLPSLRLDGYYMLADLVGVPDLFSRMGPILRSLVGRDEPRVDELKPWVRRVVTAWVLLVVPFLLYFVVVFVALAPHLVPAAVTSVRGLAVTTATAASYGRVAEVVLGVVQILLLALPWLSGAIILLRYLRRLGRLAARPLARRLAGRVPSVSRGAVLGAGGLACLLAAVLVVVLGGGGPPPSSAIPGAAGNAVSGGLGGGPSGPPTLAGRVTAVPDVASTVVEVAGRPLPVDVVGVDAASVPRCAAAGAESFARRTLAGQDVTLVPDTGAPPGAGSRWRAYVVLPSQLSYTDALVRAGWSAAGTGQYRAVAAGEEAEARADHRGMWGEVCGG